MEMILGERGVVVGGQRPVYEACFRVSLKHASLWAEIFRKLRLKGLQMEMIVRKRGLMVGGQRSCAKHVSGFVSNMLRCGLRFSKNWGWRGCFRIYICIFLIHAGQLPTVVCGRLQPYPLQEKGVAFGFAGSPCFFCFSPKPKNIEKPWKGKNCSRSFSWCFRWEWLRASFPLRPCLAAKKATRPLVAAGRLNFHLLALRAQSWRCCKQTMYLFLEVQHQYCRILQVTCYFVVWFNLRGTSLDEADKDLPCAGPLRHIRTKQLAFSVIEALQNGISCISKGKTVLASSSQVEPQIWMVLVMRHAMAAWRVFDESFGNSNCKDEKTTDPSPNTPLFPFFFSTFFQYSLTSKVPLWIPPYWFNNQGCRWAVVWWGDNVWTEHGRFEFEELKCSNLTGFDGFSTT